MLVARAKSVAEEVPAGPDPQETCEGCPGVNKTTCLYGDAVRLSDYRPGERGVIVQVCGNPDFRLRMMEMGFVKGAEIAVIKYAPLTDPVEFAIKGYHVSLRRSEAAEILMRRPQEAA